jgi:Protein of unknown function (DUF1580)
MIDYLQNEELISLAEARQGLPTRRAGKRVSLSCMYRWTKPPGCRGVVLESLQIGGCRCTSREALARFFSALTAQARGEPIAPPPPAKRRQRAIDDAKQRLASAGI